MSTLTTWLLKVRRSTGMHAVCGVSVSAVVRLHAHQVQVACALKLPAHQLSERRRYIKVRPPKMFKTHRRRPRGIWTASWRPSSRRLQSPASRSPAW